MSRLVEITKDENNYVVNPNASGGGSATAYAWKCGQDDLYVYFNFSISPETGNELLATKVILSAYNDVLSVRTSSEYFDSDVRYQKLTDDKFEAITEAGALIQFTRYTEFDITLW